MSSVEADTKSRYSRIRLYLTQRIDSNGGLSTARIEILVLERRINDVQDHQKAPRGLTQSAFDLDIPAFNWTGTYIVTLK